ncbi:hypothetical protein CDD83_4563 [Cordyceps sp. RAO-2017]|nr:hypothetical protein CDD83_4563 [Cordyceps sp. RAO-2017]
MPDLAPPPRISSCALLCFCACFLLLLDGISKAEHHFLFSPRSLPLPVAMAAIGASLLARSTLHQLSKRERNWAYREPGVVLVFCIVFIVACGLIALWIYKLMQKRKNRKQAE